MNYRTLAELNQLVSQQLDKVPSSVDLIVGVPRSGLLVANLIALKLNLPLTDVVGLCEGRLLQSGARGKSSKRTNFKHALVVDDSVYSGKSINAAKRKIAAAMPSFRVDYAAVYVAPGSQDHVDIYWEVCALPRVFEWNVMHHSIIENACVDIDGVLCRDPFESENDDGERYIQFLRSVPPLIVPTGVINTLVTCRLEKYRSITEEWLATAGILYTKLVMLDLPDGAARLKWGKHGEYKGDIYSHSGTCLFIESNESQAFKIANISTKPVLAVDINKMIYPGTVPVIKAVGFSFPIYLKNKLREVKHRLLRRMHPQSY